MIGSIQLASSFPLRSAMLLPWNQWAKWFERNTTAHESRQSQLSWNRIRILLCLLLPFSTLEDPMRSSSTVMEETSMTNWKKEAGCCDKVMEYCSSGWAYLYWKFWCSSVWYKPNGKQDGRCLKNKPLDGCTRFVLRFATCTREISATRRTTVIAVESLFDTIWLSLSSYSPNT